jgi:hypothetical protein
MTLLSCSSISLCCVGQFDLVKLAKISVSMFKGNGSNFNWIKSKTFSLAMEWPIKPLSNTACLDLVIIAVYSIGFLQKGVHTDTLFFDDKKVNYSIYNSPQLAITTSALQVPLAEPRPSIFLTRSILSI